MYLTCTVVGYLLLKGARVRGGCRPSCWRRWAVWLTPRSLSYHFFFTRTKSSSLPVHNIGYRLQPENRDLPTLCIRVHQSASSAPGAKLVYASPRHHHVDQPTHGGAGGWVGGMAVVCGGEPQPFAMTSECFGYSVQVHALFTVRLSAAWPWCCASVSVRWHIWTVLYFISLLKLTPGSGQSLARASFSLFLALNGQVFLGPH